MKESERLAELRSNDLAERCRQKAMKGDEEIFVLKEQYSALQNMYQDKILNLNKKVSKLTQDYKDLELKKQQECDDLQTKVVEQRERMMENEPENSPKKRQRGKKSRTSSSSNKKSRKMISHKPSMNRSPERYVDEDEDEEEDDQ